MYVNKVKNCLHICVHTKEKKYNVKCFLYLNSGLSCKNYRTKGAGKIEVAFFSQSLSNVLSKNSTAKNILTSVNITLQCRGYENTIQKLQQTPKISLLDETVKKNDKNEKITYGKSKGCSHNSNK